MVATAATAFDFLALASFFLLPRHLKELSASEGEIGLVMGAAGLVSVLGTPLAGSFVDRLGSRPLLLLGSLGMAACSAAMVLPAAPGVAFVALRMGQGAAFSAFFVGGTALVVGASPPGRQAQALGLFGTAALATHAVAPAVGEVIVDHAGFTPLFLAAGACSLVAAGLSLLAPPAGRRPEERSTTSVPDLLARRRVLAPVLLSAVLATGFGAAINFMTAFGVARGLTGVSRFFVAYVVCSVAVRVLGGWLPDRLGHKRVTVPAALLFAGGLAVLSVAATPAVLVAAGALFGLGHSVTYPALQALVLSRVREAHRGKTLGLYSGAFAVGMMLSAFVYGPVAQHAGYGVMYAAAAATVVAGTLAFLLGDRE